MGSVHSMLKKSPRDNSGSNQRAESKISHHHSLYTSPVKNGSQRSKGL